MSCRNYTSHYNPDIIDVLINKIEYKKAIEKVYPSSAQETKVFHLITYNGKMTEKIVNHFNKYNLKFAFKTNKSLQTMIKNNKSKTRKNEKSGVYSKKCGSENCECIYIGQTGRTFEARNKEHRQAFLNNHPEKSNVASHLLELNHVYNDNFEILHTCNKGTRLDLLETLEINRIRKTNPHLLLNSQLELNPSPLLNLF